MLSIEYQNPPMRTPQFHEPPGSPGDAAGVRTPQCRSEPGGGDGDGGGGGDGGAGVDGVGPVGHPGPVVVGCTSSQW